MQRCSSDKLAKNVSKCHWNAEMLCHIKAEHSHSQSSYRNYNIVDITTFEGVRFQTVTSWPDCSRALTIQDPMLPSPRNPILSGTVLEITNSSAELIAWDDMMSGRCSAVFWSTYNHNQSIKLISPLLWLAAVINSCRDRGHTVSASERTSNTS